METEKQLISTKIVAIEIREELIEGKIKAMINLLNYIRLNPTKEKFNSGSNEIGRNTISGFIT